MVEQLSSVLGQCHKLCVKILVHRFVEALITDTPRSKAQIRELAKKEPGLSWRRTADLLEIAEGEGLLHCWRTGQSHKAVFSTRPQPEFKTDQNPDQMEGES